MPEVFSPNYGETIHHVWDVLEYTKYPHSRRWYFGAAFFLVACIAYAIFAESNYLFAFILILIAAIFIYHELREPAVTQFAITDRGFVWRGFFFPYKEVDSFWIVYDPPTVKTLYITFKKSTTPRLAISLEDQDPNEVRATLLQYIDEDLTRDEEPLSDALERALKL